MHDYTPTLIPMDQIDDNPYQPRLTYDPAELAELAAKIAAEGLLQPPTGRRTPAGRVQLAFGHRRFRACAQLGWEALPVILRDLDDEAMARQAWAENRDRKDITAYEEHQAIKRMIETFGWSQKTIAEKLQLDPGTVSNKLRLGRLPEGVLLQLQQGLISERQAMALVPLTDLPEEARARPVFHTWVGQTSIRSIDDLMAHAHLVDSAALRKLADDAYNRATTSLAGHGGAMADWAERPLTAGEIIVAATCKACPLRIKSSNRCANQECVDARRAAHARAQAASAAAVVGLPAAAVLFDRSDTYDGLSGVPLNAIRAEAERRQCGKLGVAAIFKAWATHKVEGHPDCAVVCHHGAGGRCLCKAALARSADPAISKDAADRAEKKRIREELVKPLRATFDAALAKLPQGLVALLLRHVKPARWHKVSGDPALWAAALSEELITADVTQHLDWGTPNYAKAREALERLAAQLGVAPPWAEPDRDQVRAWAKTKVAKGAASDLEAGEPDPSATAELIAVGEIAQRLRHALDTAREFATLAIADYYIRQAEAAQAEAIGLDLIVAERLQGEIAEAQRYIAEARLLDARDQAQAAAPPEVVRAQPDLAAERRAGLRTAAEAQTFLNAHGLTTEPTAADRGSLVDLAALLDDLLGIERRTAAAVSDDDLADLIGEIEEIGAVVDEYSDILTDAGWEALVDRLHNATDAAMAFRAKEAA